MFALKNLKLPAAPENLSRESRNLWRQLVRDFAIDDACGLSTLRVGLEAYDLMRTAGSQVEREGQTFTDRFGQPRPHPLLPVLRDARAQYLAALKQLNLDVIPANPRIGRPPGK